VVPTAPGATIIVAPMPRARVRNTAAYMMGLPCARGRDGLPGDGKAFVECVMAFILSLGFSTETQKQPVAAAMRDAALHYVRVRLDFRAGDAGQREIAQDCPGPDPIIREVGPANRSCAAVKPSCIRATKGKAAS